MTAKEVLKTYYGYDDFRPLQAEIIESVLAGRDTLALMPTGGGKSLCFQVPTLAMEGLCLVITPLIALMKDQVENLRQRDIHAAAIYSGMSYDRQRAALDNCQFGPYRFLYVSPERLESEEFRQRLSLLNICLIAVDEAHCISQWGYDFRPSYLKIGDLVQALTQENGQRPPILALTATATPEVVDDIQERLGFSNKNVMRKSFARTNLQYLVRYCDDTQDTHDPANKLYQLRHILSRVPGSGIVYVRNRKRAVELSEMLTQALGEKVDYYHAGLSSGERSEKQNAWKRGDTRIIVCTNAFGMGIDKPDVRIVIHHDLPDSIEAYFQEAGRAGRDEQTAYAVLLYAPSDKTKARKRVADNYPTREQISDVYHKTCDYLQVGAGSGLGHAFALHIDRLCQAMHLNVMTTYSALHLIAQAGYIDFDDEQETQPRVQIMLSHEQLYHTQLGHEQDELLGHLMRRYSGIFTELQYIRELDEGDKQAAQRLHEQLVALAQRGIITYIPRTVACRFVFKQERQTEIYIPKSVYDQRRDAYIQRLRAMVEYAEQQQFCRSQVLLSYFGEHDADTCGKCDVCRRNT